MSTPIDHALTTMDNPWNPFTHPKEWLQYDIDHGYNTDRWIAYFCDATNEFFDEMRDLEIDYAMNKVLEVNPFGLHIKIYKNDADSMIKLANKVYEQYKTTEFAIA